MTALTILNAPEIHERGATIVLRFASADGPAECELDPINAGWLGIDMLEAAHRVHTAKDER